MAKERYQRRQADFRRDVDKLLQLVTELKQYADKNNGNTLSVDAIRKAKETELAHRVREN